MVAVSLLYRKGYFSQHLSEDGTQREEPVEWKVEDFLLEEPARVTIPLEDRRVEIRCWRYAAVLAPIAKRQSRAQRISPKMWRKRMRSSR